MLAARTTGRSAALRFRTGAGHRLGAGIGHDCIDRHLRGSRAGLLVAERRASQVGKWLTKPVASAAFMAVAVTSGALDSDYGRLILFGLVSACSVTCC